MNENYPNEAGLLAVCAILRRLDSEILSNIAGCDAGQAAALLEGDQVETTPDGYRLRADVAAAALARVRDERPADEITIHTRAFSYYLAKLEQSAKGQRSLNDEDECFHHLDALFILIGAQMEWQPI